MIPLKALWLNFHVVLFARSSNRNAVCVSVCLSIRIDGWAARIVAEDSTCDKQTPRLLNAGCQGKSDPRMFMIHAVTHRKKQGRKCTRSLKFMAR
jgi:hypothetical protein